jgi:hypothetical protein
MAPAERQEEESEAREERRGRRERTGRRGDDRGGERKGPLVEIKGGGGAPPMDVLPPDIDDPPEPEVAKSD